MSCCGRFALGLVQRGLVQGLVQRAYCWAWCSVPSAGPGAARLLLGLVQRCLVQGLVQRGLLQGLVQQIVICQANPSGPKRTQADPSGPKRTQADPSH